MLDKDWSKLKDYRCPINGCGEPLREFSNPLLPEKTLHFCTGCNFKISDAKLSHMAIIRHRKLQPPAFIEEMRNQEELNKL